MDLVLAWFANRTLSDGARRTARRRFEKAVNGLVPKTYQRYEAGGDDWGVTVLHPADRGAYRWPAVAVEGPVTAVSLGLPVGPELAGGPVDLARDLLTGADVHREVVPPFGLLALDSTGRFAVQQDWLGMCRLFVGEADGVTALANRPSPLASFLTGRVTPDLDGWTSYALCGHFGGELSPIHGTRLLRPGERITGERRGGGGWTVTSQRRYAADDIVLAGIEARGRPLEESLDRAAHALTTSTDSFYRLYDGEMTMGLSGGKDSRLIAAAVIASGRLPRFYTHEDTRAEGEVARRLVQLLQDKRGLRPEHELGLAGAPAAVLDVGLRERIRRLQRQYDYQYPSSYAVRPAVPVRLPESLPPATLSGAAGELAIDFWYPKEGADGRSTPAEAAAARVMGALPVTFVAPDAVAREQARVADLLAHADDLGIQGLALADYLYLTERMRRWSSAAYTVGLIAPCLSPAFVAASFTLTLEQKRDRTMHRRLTGRLVPEWAEVPYVSASTGPSTATRIWDGDGIPAICDLLDTAQGPISQLIQRPRVVRTLARHVQGTGPANHKLLQHFAYLAVASHQLEPGTARRSSSVTYARITGTPVPRPPHRRALSRLARVSGVRAGRRIWTGIRRRAADDQR
ncbi:hypothetical protein [Plantactinospora sonchi]|uniref:Asparagine synthetase domain-containing protein n=1 Tax=Plantactinospora sonchi TaxID=1544735 RepID=A0ABU7S4P4_9ACTN